ncbi:hypothetical protein, partial [Synechococcus sp. H70.1]|uniref:hypothetical protein n=1 Tax=Synechococcus sp. H70.1 TaxID=2964527 RepID=UPI0039C6A747
YPAVRRCEERLCPALGQSWQQQEQIAAQLETIQARIDALEARPTSHLLVWQQLAPTRQALGVFTDGADLHTSTQQWGSPLTELRKLDHLGGNQAGRHLCR